MGVRASVVILALLLLPNVANADSSLAGETSGALSARTRGGCPNIVGVWNSWAAGLFGKSDTTIRSDGTATHRSGIPGKWWCEGGQLRMSWGGEPAKSFRLSDDGRQLIGPGDSVGFSRGTAAVTGEDRDTAPSESPRPKRAARSKATRAKSGAGPEIPLSGIRGPASPGTFKQLEPVQRAPGSENP